MGEDTQNVVLKDSERIREVQTQTDTNYLLHVDTTVLVTELAMRGVTIKEIFGLYYELEEIANALSDQLFGNDEAGQHGMKPLTVEDAELAGVKTSTVNPRPF